MNGCIKKSINFAQNLISKQLNLSSYSISVLSLIYGLFLMGKNHFPLFQQKKKMLEPKNCFHGVFAFPCTKQQILVYTSEMKSAPKSGSSDLSNKKEPKHFPISLVDFLERMPEQEEQTCEA